MDLSPASSDSYSPVFGQAPNAPGRVHFPNGEERFSQWLRFQPDVREKYRRYTPEDVEEIDDREMLQWLLECYTPAAQPRSTNEAAYINLMRDCLSAKLATF